MANIPDYSQYIAVKKINVAQTGNTNTSIIKGRAPYRYNGYFPLYKSIQLPTNALLSNKFRIITPAAPAIPFSPLQITGLNVWLDASDLTTITSSGGAVSQWNDKTTNGYNLTQSNNTYKPTYSNNIMTFASDRNFDIPNAAINNATTYDFFIVFNPKVSVNWIIGKQRDTFYTPTVVSMTNYIDSGLFTGTTNYVYFRAGGNPLAASTINSNSALSLNTLQIFSIHFDGSTCLFNSNGNTLNSISGLSIPNVPTVSSFKLGALFANTAYTNTGVTNFDLCEMMFFNSNISVSDRQKVEGYLANKWGLQGSLPSDHPYKNTAP